ncbi:family 16 glycoside hydrolase [Bradyrhizobium erythrophlei]|uniref:family 16 glycoside hydrolase n=1 Tax=Bradyrhizobium erythrophlei TaxID=1437360 RepID=UPI0035E640BB
MASEARRSAVPLACVTDGTAFSNPAWSAVYTGFEIQIDNAGAGQPAPGMPIHRTGAVYAVGYPANPTEIFPAATPGDFISPQDAIVLGWNQYRIEVKNNVIKVALNGTNTALHHTGSRNGALPAAMGPASRPPSGKRVDFRRSAVLFEL